MTLANALRSMLSTAPLPLRLVGRLVRPGRQDGGAVVLGEPV